MCTYRQVWRLNFKKRRNIFSGIFKLASTYYLKQQTSNRTLHPKEKGDFYHFKLLLTLFACNCKVQITTSQESLYQMAIKMCCLWSGAICFMPLSKIEPRFSKAIVYRKFEIFIYTHAQVFCWCCSEVSLMIMSHKKQSVF